MRYEEPILGDNKVVYKGKRYWIIEFIGKFKIDEIGIDDCQFIMYDKYNRRILATIDIKDGKYCASLAWGIDHFFRNFDTLKEVAKGVPDMNDYYAKHCFG
jgi:hypothetical protein